MAGRGEHLTVVARLNSNGNAVTDLCFGLSAIQQFWNHFWFGTKRHIVCMTSSLLSVGNRGDSWHCFCYNFCLTQMHKSLFGTCCHGTKQILGVFWCHFKSVISVHKTAQRNATSYLTKRIAAISFYYCLPQHRYWSYDGWHLSLCCALVQSKQKPLAGWSHWQLSNRARSSLSSFHFSYVRLTEMT